MIHPTPSRSAGFAALLCAGLLTAAAGAETPDQERVPVTETADSDAVVAAIEGAIRAAFVGGARPSRRDAHAKGHGCVRADFTVRPDLPPALRHGVFAEARSFKAWIRFSNSAGTPQHDYDGDARGMAIKLTGVPGQKLLAQEADETTQDFVMINYPVFFIRNVRDYALFVSMVLAGKTSDFFATHVAEGRIFAAFNATPVDNVLTQRFFSGSPYRLGDGYIKFSARPVKCVSGAAIHTMPGLPPTNRPDFLRENLVTWLRDKDACFDFAVQPQADPSKQPIEDTTIAWKETDAPFVTVASIHIARQIFDTPAQQSFCENLSFTPWHALPDHRPVGGINRLRRRIYTAISTLRHTLNGVSRGEPSGTEVFK